MNKDALSAWLEKLPPGRKMIFLLGVMHELTIAMRSIFHDHAGSWRVLAETSSDISELNHRLTGVALAILENRPTYSDEALAGMIFAASDRPELSSCFPLVLERVIQRMPD